MGAEERINAEVWSSRKVLGLFAARDGYIDAGEELLLPRLAAAAGRPLAPEATDTADSAWLYLLARKPAAGVPG